MFGTNPLRKQELNPGLAVQEIFHTIQGEGPFAGVPAVFIRLAGCNLRCFFCDTEFESGINNVLDLSDVVGRVEDCAGPRTTLVVLTGGEPFRQNIAPLVYALNAKGYAVQIETAGTLWIPGFQRCLDLNPDASKATCSIVVSPKTGKVVPEIISWAYAWKYIVTFLSAGNPVDGLPETSTQVVGLSQRIARPPAHIPTSRIFLQPREEYDENRQPDKRATERNMQFAAGLCMRYGYRLSLQTHKFLGLP